uniref:Retrovirus-related Pol polyprotein from transposon TNT 1-94 n=1 Tax=Tanacetum cinerariifolium TaxID=118510 RepID=A0A6L2NDN9_TANCI|nr:retrovirus-related Pol polyprotein from transposon TNT 1-94 [Tanacetum cinerariifolium]
MLCYLARMKPYYLKCIKNGPFQPKIPDGDAKSECQWTLYERRVIVQDQRLKSIIMSCLPDDIVESIISCFSAKEAWTDLVHSFEGPSDTKENRIIDLKLEYQTFKAESTESLSQIYTRYKTLLNEIANDGVNLSKLEIKVGIVNSLPEKWLTFSQGLRNANHTQTLDLADVYGSQADPKFPKDYKAEYKKMKANLALLEDEEEVSDKEEVTQVKVLMALVDDELTVGKNHAHNDKKKVNEKWLTVSKKVSQCISEKIPHQKKKVLGGELFTESSSKINENENILVPAFMGYDQEMVPKTKDLVERLNLDIKLLNFNTGRILVPESQAVNESLESTRILNTPELSKDSEAESLTPLPPLKNL